MNFAAEPTIRGTAPCSPPHGAVVATAVLPPQPGRFATPPSHHRPHRGITATPQPWSGHPKPSEMPHFSRLHCRLDPIHDLIVPMHGNAIATSALSPLRLRAARLRCDDATIKLASHHHVHSRDLAVDRVAAPASSQHHLIALPQQHLTLHRHPLFAATNGESPQSLARREYRDPPWRHTLPCRGNTKAELFRSWTLTS